MYAIRSYYEELRKLFSVCGKVTYIHMVKDAGSGEFVGCAFVKMNTDVITSYSIHYTKLYDTLHAPSTAAADSTVQPSTAVSSCTAMHPA